MRKPVGVSWQITGTCLSSPLPTKEMKGFGHLVSEEGPKEISVTLNELLMCSVANSFTDFLNAKSKLRIYFELSKALLLK